MFCCFFSSRRRHTRWPRDWSSDVCSSDLGLVLTGTVLVLGCAAYLAAHWLPPTPRVLLLAAVGGIALGRSEEHTSELQSRGHLVCRLLLEKKKNTKTDIEAEEG